LFVVYRVEERVSYTERHEKFKEKLQEVLDEN